MDIRESFQLPEEVSRSVSAGLQKDIWTAMPVQVTQDTTDGHVATVQPTIQRQFVDPGDGTISYQDHPVHTEVPITHLGGGGVTHTHMTKQGDTGKIVYAARPLDTWYQSDGTSNQPIDNRMHSIADGMYIPGVRSVVRKLEQVSNESSQLRSDDGKNTIDHHPTNGTQIKAVDPSTAPASATFSPFAAAAKFFSHLVHPTTGVQGNATDGSTTHQHGVDHVQGPFMKAVNALHSVLCDPSNGPSMNAQNNLHQVLAHPTMGAQLVGDSGASKVIAGLTGVMISSSQMVSISAPSMSLPSGGVSGSALASGAAASNVGPVGGDLSGTLPNPQVIGITHVTGANLLPNAANDSAAATAGVAVGSLYRNGSVLMVRVA